MNKMYYIVDSRVENGIIAFCSTYESAKKMCREYCADIYDSEPENVESVWIEDYTLDTSTGWED